jgi:hypothetical protein
MSSTMVMLAVFRASCSAHFLLIIDRWLAMCLVPWRQRLVCSCKCMTTGLGA